MIIDAKFYDGNSSKEHDVKVEFTQEQRLIVEQFGIDISLDQVKIATRLGNTLRLIELPNGARIKSEENDKIDHILEILNIDTPPIHKLEKSWKLALASLVVVAFTVIFMLTVGADYTANFLAQRISPHVLDSTSKNALEQMDKSFLKESNLTEAKKQAISKLFNKLVDGSKDYKLHFRSSPKMGANAFMFPSGDVVLLDELVQLDDDPHLYGILGVLAHEKGHFYYRHGLKGIIKGGITSALIGYITGDISSIATALPTMVISTKYSRDYESQADSYAKSELKRLGIPTKPLADLFIKMEEYYKKKHGDAWDVPSWLSSHPVTSSRIEFFNEN